MDGTGDHGFKQPSTGRQLTHIMHVRNLKMAESGRRRIKCRVPEAGLEERGCLSHFSVADKTS